MNRKKAPVLREDRGQEAVIRLLVDYARARRRPSVSPEGKAVVMDMSIRMRDWVISTALVNTKKPGGPPGNRVLAFI